MIEHRQFVLPSKSLVSSTLTAIKIGTDPICRMCLRPGRVRQITRHHLVPDSWFRRQPDSLRTIRNAHANIVPLCRPCHDRVDSRDLEERAEARRHLRRSLAQQEIAFAIQVRGREWLDENYPRLIESG
jgi:HNH endonuclease.